MMHNLKQELGIKMNVLSKYYTLPIIKQATEC